MSGQVSWGSACEYQADERVNSRHGGNGVGRAELQPVGGGERVRDRGNGAVGKAL